jgi:hypothetical protein
MGTFGSTITKRLFMRTSTKYRTPVRSATANNERSRSLNVDRSTSSIQLSAEQIPVLEARDVDIPSAIESAEALGFDEIELQDEIRSEELQRHPDAHDNEDDLKGLEGLTRELHRRLSGERPR